MSERSARERILDAAHQLVLQRGFAATTVDAVLAEASASKGAFFHHFPSKAHLGRALVERYAEGDAQALETAMSAAEAETDDPGEQLVCFLRSFEEGAEAVLKIQPSCLFISFIYETELADAGTDDIVARSILHWRERILDKLEQAAADRPALRAVDLPSLADQLFTVFEGAFLLTRALGDKDAMGRQLSHLRHYVELLVSRG
ncbi:TetR/AcrR family transcriptional regulator [Phytoactinopolyspora halotolerans]|uniref:TetR/AcrR family transcriptional regulator n=1 Tax=Phytoactinopolyspora halotolerans TaxID=1981512 RepID=A0A6L9SIY2_9ACTN|nr:TetR/AcrR family transcriptional regulator [Phytoactinopolyspora halotolerans]NEE04251.1 TetR/AcrR family transcriptional regulator [Phytoactinopolyspora halotolerans]